MQQNWKKLFLYNHWANQEVIAFTENISQANIEIVKILAHIIGAEWLWLNRLKADAQTKAVWPELTLAQCKIELTSLYQAWHHYLEQLSTPELDRIVTYKNSKGQEWQNSVTDILTHLNLHSAYHRGQIATKTRQSGYAPAYTDFIHAARNNLI